MYRFFMEWQKITGWILQASLGVGMFNNSLLKVIFKLPILV
jgi:hypothetical protein